MKNIFKRYLKITLFYVIFFAFWRLLFLIFNFKNEKEFSWPAALPSFFHGLRMDISVSCYFLVPSLLLLLAYLIRPFRLFSKIEFWFHVIILIALNHIVLANVALYHFWNSMINFRAVSYLADPSEVLTSLSGQQSATMFFVLVTMIFASVFVFRKFFFEKMQPASASIASSVAFVMLALFSVIGMRGGVQMLPMNESLVYYSKNNFMNHASVNPVWHLAYDVYTAGLSTSNPFEKYDAPEVKSFLEKLKDSSQDSFPKILSSSRPDIVVLILESFTADVVSSLNGEKNVDPFLETIISQGVLFDSIYSSGTRTDQGIVSVINGWPATPYHSIMRSSEKSARLPSLVKVFGSRDYTTSFYYGGESNFSNLDAYNVSQKYNRVISKENFDASLADSRWGVDDETLLLRQIKDLSSEKEPFFSALMTLSNHEPFDVPGPARFPGKSEADKFRNSAAYTDASLKKYFDEARKEKWFANTLFILVADHGHRLPEGRLILQPLSRHIPLLFFGDVIKKEFRGKRISKAGGHHDIAATLLCQLGINPATFSWSKNLLDPAASSYSFYQFEETVAWIEKNKWTVYSYNTKSVVTHAYPLSPSQQDSLVTKSQKYVQGLYAQYQLY